MNIIDRIKYFLLYKKVIDKNKQELLTKFNIRVDDVYRLYTVISIDDDEFKLYGGDKPVLYQIPDIDVYLDQSQATRDGLINGEMFLQKKGLEMVIIRVLNKQLRTFKNQSYIV